ncbi:hypothetical protein R5R35_014631 [Gryllus longicercus]|uniref:DNA-directed RNA polymerase subunit n=1 Tax=Gryllus longicercus TaxID=2509291 RepID=A0AAN9Z599_9ORTH|nr:DNA-directed RNA polymerase subunit [Gryllus bimaculatus]
MEKEIFVTEPGFCPCCGAILPDLKLSGGVTCYTCAKPYGPEVFGRMEMKYTIHFNSPSASSVNTKKKSAEPDGPTVDRKCPVCNNDKMSYATLQLRSADEGQTVFYTCTKCKYKETENS